MSPRTSPLPVLVLAATAAACLAATPVQAQLDQTLTIVGHDENGTYFFTVQGLDGQNPPIRLRPGTNVTVEFRNDGPDQPHNIHFGAPIDRQTAVLDPGESETLQFTVPDDATGEAEYWCDPHRQQGMVGELRYEPPGGGLDDGIDDGIDDGVGDGGDGADGEPDNGTPGPRLPLVLASLAAAAVVRRR